MKQGLHVQTISDANGVEWKAEQDLTSATGSMGHPNQALVTFTRITPGEPRTLTGWTQPFSPASGEELTAALAEAQRRHEHDTKGA